MKKIFLVISMLLALAIVAGGCATKGDIEEVQARDDEIAAKADQAARDAQEAKVEADDGAQDGRQGLREFPADTKGSKRNQVK